MNLLNWMVIFGNTTNELTTTEAVIGIAIGVVIGLIIGGIVYVVTR